MGGSFEQNSQYPVLRKGMVFNRKLDGKRFVLSGPAERSPARKKINSPVSFSVLSSLGTAKNDNDGSPTAGPNGRCSKFGFGRSSWLLPCARSLDDRDVPVHRQFGKAIDTSAGLGPFDLQPIDLRALA